VEDEARGIWAQLQQRDWVNPDLDLDWVMEKLAHNREPWELLARDRDTDSGPVGVWLITGPRSDQSSATAAVRCCRTSITTCQR